MNDLADIIIIGAGASGLMTGKLLAASGKKVLFMEGKSQAGGRIQTMWRPQTGDYVEAGAEFVHGDLKTTMQQLQEGGISYSQIKGANLQFKQGQFKQEENLISDWPLLMEKLNGLKEDMTMKNFLDSYFNGDRYEELRKYVKNFLEGYDAATLDKASAIALRDEWSGENEAKQYRINGGYGKLIDYLKEECIKQGALFYFNTVVKGVLWKTGEVQVFSENGQCFKAEKVVVTIPLGVLNAAPEERGAIVFDPALTQKKEAIQKMGYGSVIKILMTFKRSFWKETPQLTGSNNKSGNFSFLFSDAEIPTWWTQFPEESSTLTGWLAGPKAAAMESSGEEKIASLAIDSLCYIFSISKEELTQELVRTDIFNWSADPLAKGAYSYAAIKHTNAMQVVKASVEQTLFFAGEAFYEGPEIGTVEAALASGKETADEILHQDI